MWITLGIENEKLWVVVFYFVVGFKMMEVRDVGARRGRERIHNDEEI